MEIENHSITCITRSVRNIFNFFAMATPGCKYPFLMLVIALIAGILCGEEFHLPLAAACVGTVVVYLFCFVRFIPFLHIPKNVSDAALLLAVFVCGALLVQKDVPQPDTAATYRIEGVCKERLSRHNYILSRHGQRLYLNNPDTTTLYHPGDSLLFCGKIHPLTDNANTGEFSYSRYLRQKGVRFKAVPLTSVEKTGRSHNLLTRFEDLRRQLMQKNSSLLKDSLNTAIVNALSLGWQNDLDNETQQLFAATGTIHLLSVSGLHTGAIYLLILFLFKATGLYSKKTELLVIPLLWAYACLTGLSPSVVRAATILSFITAGKVLGKDYTPVNAIAASAFLTLLIRPALLYSISFQLSYAAYLGIVTLYPFFYNLPGKLSPVPAKIYASLCVTLAAQLPALPICAYYFHTVGLNSFLANLVAVPIATLLLYSATVFLLLPAIIGAHLAFITNFLCSSLLWILQAFRPASLNLYELYPETACIALLYICLISGSLFLLKRTSALLRRTIFFTVALLLYSCVSNYCISRKSEIAVFNIHNKTAVLLNHNGFYSLLKNTAPGSPKITPYILKNKLRPYPEPHSGLLSYNIRYAQNGLQSNAQTVCIADRLHRTAQNAQILIVTENLRPGEVFLQKPAAYPSRIIIDASNSRSRSREWENFCIRENIPFAKTADLGTVTITLK